jgi:hypothetical protein
MYLENVALRMVQNGSSGSAVGLNSKSGKVHVTKGSFVLEGVVGIYVASNGVFEDCFMHTTATSSHSSCISADSDSFVRIRGGELYAYTPSGYVASCIFVGSAAATGVVIAEGVNCPTYARSGFIQTYAVRDLSNNGLSTYQSLITPLTVQAASQNVANTAVVNKPNRT